MMNSNSNRSKKLRAAQPRAPPPHARRRHRNAGSRSSAELETFNSSISSRTTVQHPDEFVVITYSHFSIQLQMLPADVEDMSMNL